MPYQAPYYHYEEGVVPGQYIVMFYKGHTLAKHFTFLGREFDLMCTYTPDWGYCADLDDQLFDVVRRDPGVELVQDNFNFEDTD